MEESYKSLLLLGDEIEKYTNILRRQSIILSCYSKLIVLLCGMKYQLPIADIKLLESYFCPELQDGLTQGWEEIIEASTTYLLKTCLAKNVKESTALNNTVLEIPNNTDRLLKHIALVFDRISKGARLVFNIQENKDSKKINNINIVQVDEK